MKLPILLALLFSTSFVFSNNPDSKKAILSGTIMDAATGEPLEYATITIMDMEKQIVTGTVSDENGKFNLELKTGDYQVRVEFLAFATFEKQIALNSDLDMGTIELTVNAQLMEEVEVVAEKSQVELKLDKKVFNVGKDITSQGGTANDVLENVPSVSVESSGAVSLRGNSGVTILINGRPSVIAANNGLSQIPAQDIEKIEVITNPSARYEAAGTAGIINIILKRNRLNGVSGSVQLTTGIPANHSASVNASYKNKKLNVFGNGNLRYSDFIGFSTNHQTNTNNGITRILDQEDNQTRNDKAGNFYIGGDYYFNDKNTLTASFFRYALDNTDKTILQYDFKNTAGQLDSALMRTENYFEPQRYNQLEGSYVKTFEQKGKKWTVDFQYDFFNDDEQANILAEQTNPWVGKISEIRTRDIESSKDFLLQSDFVLPIKEKGTLELGIRGENRIITSDYNIEELISDTWQIFNDIDNSLDYTERIGGAYVQYGYSEKKWSYLLGLRTEYTEIIIEDLKETFGDKKEYTQFFPTLHLNYGFSESSKIQLSYSRRINRPRFWQLNPFGGFTDYNSVFVGNPDLNPAYTNSVELGFLKNFEKFTFNPSIYFQRTIDYFRIYIEPTDNNRFLEMPINLDSENRYGLELSTSYNPAKWLQLSGEFNFYQFDQKGAFEQQDFGFKNATWFTRLNARLRFPSEITFQARFNYSGEDPNAQTITKAQYYADFGLSKNFLKDNKATLSINVRDAFNSRKNQSVITAENYTVESSRQRTLRLIGLSLQYRFNKKQNQRDRQPGNSNRN